MSAVPDAARRPLPDGGGVAARYGGERGVQERAVAVRSDATRRRGVHTVRQLPAAGNRAAAGRGSGAVLGDPVGRVPKTGRRPAPSWSRPRGWQRRRVWQRRRQQRR